MTDPPADVLCPQAEVAAKTKSKIIDFIEGKEKLLK